MKKVMITIFCLSILLIRLFIGLKTFVYASPSCTQWLRQPNGCYWRTCVDDNGRQYCQESCRGQISTVKCE